MLFRLCFIVAVLLSSTTLYGQNKDPFQRLKELINRSGDPILQTEVNLIHRIDDRLRTPQSEVEDAIVHLSTRVNKADLPYIRFFSTYAVKPQYRDDLILTLSFCMHSLVGISDDPDEGNAGGYYPLAKMDGREFKTYRRVPGSDTLWWIDLREYNWTPQAWETISLGDGYFSEPVVRHDRSGALRLMSGNAVLRADWFVSHVMSSTEQLDLDGENNFYNTLLYAMKKKAPENIEEFRQAWGLDIKKARLIGNEYGSLVTKSEAVARHNRMIFGYRTELGYLYETYDVKNHHGKRDYLEGIILNKRPGGPPEVSDAGEAFATNMLGLQVYALRDGAGNLVEFADPTLARHMSDVIGDARVNVARSCIDCHASGPIPAENTLQEIVNADTKLKFYQKRDSLRLKRTLLSKKFTDSVTENQEYFEKGLKKCNGLEPDENGKLFLNAIRNYRERVDLETAAYECGVTVEEFKNKIVKYNPKFGSRLKLLIQTGEPIPRDLWESPGKDGIPGAFQQAMILINGLTTVTTEKVEKKVIVPKIIEKDTLKQGTINRGIIFNRNSVRPFLHETHRGIALVKYRLVVGGAMVLQQKQQRGRMVVVGRTKLNDEVYGPERIYARDGIRYRYVYFSNGSRGLVEVNKLQIIEE